MVLAEVIEQVQGIVLRPDLAGELSRRVLTAITACHSVAYNKNDLAEFVLPVVGGTAAIGNVVLDRDLRTVDTVYALDSSGTIIADLHEYAPAELTKLRRMGKDFNTCYRSNLHLNFKATAPVHSLLVVGYLTRIEPSKLYLNGNQLNPLDVSTPESLGNYTNWLLQDYPQAVIDHAVGYGELLKGNKDLSSISLEVFNRVHVPHLINLATGQSKFA